MNNSRFEHKARLLHKRKQECQLCFNKNKKYLQFHHIYPETKLGSMTQMLYNGKIDAENFIEEMDKCIVLCPSCHKKFIYKWGDNPC